MKVLITGGTNGMGKGVVKILAAMDNQSHEIIILCRSRELGDSTIREVNGLTGNQKMSIVLCDLSKLNDVNNVITEIKSKHKYLDAIFINAGLGYAAKSEITEDGMDPHFQVNYLSQFMLTINLLELLEKSENGGRVIFNVTKRGEIFWDDMQMKKNWKFENGIIQAMAAKRMFYLYLNDIYNKGHNKKISFIGFQIPKTVWSNQLNIIPLSMKIMATLMKLLGTFISIDECGRIMAPLFTEKQDKSINKSGKLITMKKNSYIEMEEDEKILDKSLQKKLFKISLDLCNDERAVSISQRYLK